ncbi:VC0807 family protein [Nocardioides sp. SOB77]|uniref:VC0807 family protein n=1 Tax=Nocardioides oceani TaxID=3058369 RepID=A0ABT8FI60_9ACTN|nr:VC0807 family protein [Nocardioides oceani]MDN4174135.1 VC0807 family protein [Nocardioides oceani]
MPQLPAPVDEALLAPLDDRADDCADGVPPVVRPRLGAVLRRVSVSLLVACVVPAALFYTCFRLTDVWVAMAAALGWSYGAIAWRVVTRRRPSGLLYLTAAVMTVRTLVSVALDSTYLYFLQPIVTDAAIATLFLASLATARPVVARLAGDFYPLDDELALRPGVRRLFRRLTLLWGAIGAAKAAGTLWLLESQPLDTFVLVKTVTAPTLNGLTVAATIAAVVVVARREGLLERVVQPVPSGA